MQVMVNIMQHEISHSVVYEAYAKEEGEGLVAYQVYNIIHLPPNIYIHYTI